MDWLSEELRSPRYTIRYCAYEIGRRSVEEWLARCERTVGPVVSGAVFSTGAGRRIAAQASFASQLGALATVAA
jgi:hypothetical protein